MIDKLNPGEVTVFKLISGEEIVATVVHINKDSVEIEKTIALVQQLDPQTGRPIPMILPWGNSSKDPKRISFNHILYPGVPVDRLKEAYAETFSQVIAPRQGIVVPGK
jgi:hypothetical protein